jgi:putative endonuclease
MARKSGPSSRSVTNAEDLLRLHHGQRANGTLYTGVTNDIARRAWEHREGLVGGFKKKYGVSNTLRAHF